MRPGFFAILTLYNFFSCQGQPPLGVSFLKVEKEITMPDVKGRIDHMAVNLKDKVLYMAALGNNTVEVIDLNKGIILKSVPGVEEPQGIAYLPLENEIAVASGGNGDCIFFNANTFEKTATIHLAGDADNIRFDSLEKKMYVGYGNGGIAIIDPATHKQIGDVKLPAHPESFQLDKKHNRMYVNLPDDKSIAVIDLKSFTVSTTWQVGKYTANFPMSLDTANNLVFVGFRHPATLVSYDAMNGQQMSANELVDDADDIFYYAHKQEVIASGGGGYINIFKRQNNNAYTIVSKIATTEGARTSFLIPALRTFVVAERANSGKPAAVVVYTINDQ